MIALMVLCGGVGAVMRFISDGLLRTVLGRTFPWSTMIINLAGSMLLGYLAALALTHPATSNVKLVIGVGFCGGFTTFSTSVFESVRLLEERRYMACAIQCGGGYIACCSVAFIGMLLATV